MAENMGTEMVVANQTMDIVSKEEKNNSAIMSTPSALHLNEEKESTQKVRHLYSYIRNTFG